MALFAGLFSLAGLSLFLARFLQRSSALMPIVAVSLCMLFFTLAGVLGVLQIAGYLWYALCLAALVAAIALEKKRFWKLFSPGLVFFLAMSAFFILLYYFTRPMLVQWDEFTFWGTAAKVTCRANELYTTATSNLIARTYPPGLIVFSYMMRFFGGFTEHGFLASYAVLYLACFAAGSALWGKNKTAGILYFAAMLALPLLFEVNWPPQQMTWAYLTGMCDMPMAAMFGASLCFYFAGGAKGGRLLLPFGVVLAALTNIKDMGLALALIALFVAALDLLLCERETLSFLRLRRWKGLLAGVAACFAMIAGSYLLWWWHLQTPAVGVDRFDVGNMNQSLNQIEMLLAGVKALLGIEVPEQFAQVLPMMGEAFFTRRIWLFGSGAVLLVVIALILAAAFLFSATRRQRRRVLVFSIAMLFCFVAFYIFNIFTYSFVFRPAEALVLKDYNRYIAPFWVGWLMAALVLLGQTAVDEKATYYRLRMARAGSVLVALALVAGVLLRGNLQANFLNVSPALYTERLNLKGVVAAARAEGMQKGDKVYIISQGDDGSRFYLFGYEMDATRSLLYNGYLRDEKGEPILNEADRPIYYGNAAVTLVSHKGEGEVPYGMSCTREELTAFLWQESCTHVLIDVLDEYVLEEFSPLFEDERAGWSGENDLARGHRYYKIEWQKNGTCRLVSTQEMLTEGSAAP